VEADVLYEQGMLENDKGSLARAQAKLDAAANLYKRIGADKGFQDAVRSLNDLKKKAND
jgi:hypothetical protein